MRRGRASDPTDAITAGGFLRAVRLLPDRVESSRAYPWSIPAVRRLGTLELHPKVTFFAGDNGSGKSTVLEGIADLAGFGEQGGSKHFNQAAHRYWSDLGRALEPVRGVRREKDGFYLRAESFFNVATTVDELEKEQPGLIRHYGGRSLHRQSHGESFLALAANRFAGEGLYLLDEPEAALSPSGQLAFLRVLRLQTQGCGSQFVIATHSPIIMAYPDSRIYRFSADGIATVGYEATEHFELTRDFPNHRERYFRRLFDDGVAEPG